MRRLPKCLFGLFLLVVGTGVLVAATPQECGETVVIYNANSADGKELADFYCHERGIDPSNQIPLRAPLGEEISREEYDLSVAGPLRKIFQERGYWLVTKDMLNRPIVVASKIRTAALVRGMPLKIRQCSDYPGDGKVQPDPYGSCNAASVDSELSVLGLFTPQISGLIKNPLAENFSSESLQSPQTPPWLLRVGRLDGPTMESVRAMILNGIKVEREGLWGWGYIDLRGTHDPAYMKGDAWIRRAGEEMRRHGIPVITDDLPGTIQEGFPVTDAAAYYGWYSERIDGPFADPAFRFVPGAVAAHLHSFSASTLRDPSKGWTGPLVMHGATATVGNVYEPYLIFTTDFGAMASVLLTGATLSDAYYAAQPVLSWMSVLVGDPLYRPYACFSDEGGPVAGNRWSEYRRLILAHNGDVLDAVDDLRTIARQGGESFYLEALGEAQLAAGKYADAAVTFREATGIEKREDIRFRIMLETARSLEKLGKTGEVLTLLREGSVHIDNTAQRVLLQSWITRLNSLSESSGAK